ncbi:PREDICTED: uncharacterized protein LOC104610412 isoform X2 [Nelumbo nucifera]|uniref:Uncharacterized protein LOC104610412 isoform X1 n=1 Tax=Nelumbo nucifera TaxID=4432 RepID=A0A1U8B3E4_NELNU|nr:PREDICTED: uncharacterized protein LOC104610412 isoform X1 [Nelumbo nucifera]XP_010275328.1 PREDICTED: uncharacterized protein LOC104610412 isoform X2 [Nelumbo nucifera]
MASTPKRRKSLHKTPNHESSSLAWFLTEPSPDLFPSKEEFLRLLAVVSIALSVAIGCNYAVSVLNRQSKPFCDSGGASEDSVSDDCEPCPNNGECFEGKLECFHGYKKHGRLCVEDGEINQTAKKLSEWVQLRVCEAYVQFLCDGTGTIWVQEMGLWKELDGYRLNRNFGLSNDSFVYTKQKALEAVESLLETRRDSNGVKELKCPDWLAERYKPFLCYIRQWILENTLYLLPISTLLVGFITLLVLLLRRVRRSRYLSSRAEQLYQQVCDILEENAIMAKNVNGEGEPWVVASQLRDHLLLPRERKDPLLWKKVEELVQEDSRLDQYPKLVKGESKVVWEWQVEGSLSSSRMKAKGRMNKLKSSWGMCDSSAQQQQEEHQQQQQQRHTLKALGLLNS